MTKGTVIDRRLLLLKEYTAKFRRVRREASALRQKAAEKDPDKVISKEEWRANHADLLDYVRRVKPVAMELARHVSQHIMHGDTDIAEKLEFQLRLAELEQVLLNIDAVLQAARPL